MQAINFITVSYRHFDDSDHIHVWPTFMIKLYKTKSSTTLLNRMLTLFSVPVHKHDLDFLGPRLPWEDEVEDGGGAMERGCHALGPR